MSTDKSHGRFVKMEHNLGHSSNIHVFSLESTQDKLLDFYKFF